LLKSVHDAALQRQARPGRASVRRYGQCVSVSLRSALRRGWSSSSLGARWINSSAGSGSQHLDQLIPAEIVAVLATMGKQSELMRAIRSNDVSTVHRLLQHQNVPRSPLSSKSTRPSYDVLASLG